MGTSILLLGLAVAFLAQIYGTFRAFKVSALQGILCFVIPGWLLFVAKRHGFYQPVVGVWFAGVVAIIIGTMSLS
ncbi:MAG: hypothetical protein EPO06_04810 [Burkholderiaceae bacterium]|nr:MAG: hypothetical protein EPO06_04810 [Burkholderiaceae bacterium]